MKSLVTILVLFIGLISFAQNGINYKAVVKDDLGNVLVIQTLDIQFTILQGVSQTNVYQETHTVTTDTNGVAIANIGQGNTSDDFSTIDWGSATHFLNVQIDTGSGLIDMGTSEFKTVPYALYAQNGSGLEAIDEGNGIGYRLSSSDPTYFGNIGSRAVDLSYGGDSGYDAGLGAIGTGSVAMGEYTTASNGSVAMGYNSSATGQYATAMGNVTTASGLFSTTAGFYTVASALYSTALGNTTIADDQNTTVIGKFNNNTLATNTLFQVGNGTNNDNRSNAFVVDNNGIITAPSFDISEITDNKALITKEFADANYSGGGSGTNPTGLEALDEGNGVGWRLIGRNPSFYGNIGEDAVDLSYSYLDGTNFGATGDYAIAIGFETTASGNYSTAIGRQSIASGVSSTAMGRSSTASSEYATAIGFQTTASGTNSTAIGELSIASGTNSTAMGFGTIADDVFSTAVGIYNDHTYSSSSLFQVGNGSPGVKRNAFNIDSDGTITAPSFDISEITDDKALVTKEYLDANAASGLEAINEGNGVGWRLVGRNISYYGTIGNNAVDLSTSLTSSTSHGATGLYSTALGYRTEASNLYSTAMGNNTTASGEASTASGTNTQALGRSSTALGNITMASGNVSFATGELTLASAFSSTAMGRNTIADDPYTTVVGNLNDNTTSATTLFQVGNGSSISNRSNAFTVFQNGSALLAGTLTQSSDRRLKKDIEDINYGLNEILALHPKSYKWKNENQDYRSLGLIAQEVEPIIKEIVHTAEDKDKTLSVSYVELIPVLIKAIQEQQTIIENQKKTIDGLVTEANDKENDLTQLNQRVKQIEHLLKTDKL